MLYSRFSLVICFIHSRVYMGCPQWLSSKGFTCNAENIGDAGSILGSRRSPGGGNGNSLWYSCWENLMDSGAWQATVRPQSGKSQIQLSIHANTDSIYVNPSLPVHPIPLLSSVSICLFSTFVSVFLL